MMQSQQQQRFEPSAGESFHHFRSTRGSLPLKKRRFHEITSSTAPGENMLSLSASEAAGSINVVGGCNSADEKIAALALVAAATGGTNILSNGATHPYSNVSSTSSIDYLQPSSQSHSVGEHALSGMYQQQHQQQQLQHQMYEHHFSKARSFYDQAQDIKTQGNVDRKDAPQIAAANSSKSSAPRQRVHHPPLAAPIPGGCHGRTSRNNSYCRRTPCYNGSKYCKLHYQQYVVQGGGSPNGESNTKHEPSLSDGSDNNAEKQIIGKAKNIGSSEGGENNSSHQRNHQDKRFTGINSDEVQCLATTTRGRPCAYVAVNCTKYCNLHADYDTNPPPRRGGGGGNKSKTAANSAKSEHTLSSKESNANPPNVIQSMLALGTIAASDTINSQYTIPGSTLEPVTSLQPYDHRNLRYAKPVELQPSGNSTPSMASSVEESSQSSTIASRSSGGTNKISAEKDLSSSPVTLDSAPPYPLLNSIPSDQWSNKLVLISTGPLLNHTGRVVKWGNGWITVSTNTGGTFSELNGCELLHNRRAIELYLLPEDEKQPDAMKVPAESGNKLLASNATTFPSQRGGASETIVPKVEESIAKEDELKNIGNPTVEIPNMKVKEKEHAHEKLSYSIPKPEEFTVTAPPEPENSETEMSNGLPMQFAESHFVGTNTNHHESDSKLDKAEAETNKKEAEKEVSPTPLSDTPSSVTTVSNETEEIKKVTKQEFSVKEVKEDKEEVEDRSINEHQVSSPITITKETTLNKPEDTESQGTSNHPVTQQNCNPVNVKQSVEFLVCEKISKFNEDGKQKSSKETEETFNISPTEGSITCPKSVHIETNISDKIQKSDSTSSPQTRKEVKQALDALFRRSNAHEITNEAEEDASSQPQSLHVSDGESSQVEHGLGEKRSSLSLMEELILAQTGRRVKNVDLVFCSGGRTIHKPERYEDTAMIAKKRHNEGDHHCHDAQQLPKKKKGVDFEHGKHLKDGTCGEKNINRHHGTSKRTSSSGDGCGADDQETLTMQEGKSSPSVLKQDPHQNEKIKV